MSDLGSKSPIHHYFYTPSTWHLLYNHCWLSGCCLRSEQYETCCIIPNTLPELARCITKAKLASGPPLNLFEQEECIIKIHHSCEFLRTLWKYNGPMLHRVKSHWFASACDQIFMVLPTLTMDHAILYVCHKEAVEVTINFICGPNKAPIILLLSSFSSSYSCGAPVALGRSCTEHSEIKSWRGVEGKRWPLILPRTLSFIFQPVIFSP